MVILSLADTPQEFSARLLEMTGQARPMASPASMLSWTG